MMACTLRIFSKLPSLALVIMTGMSVAYAQEDYPNRPIRLVVPTAPGGSTDIVARLIAQGLSERLGRQVVVENRAGASTIIGTEIVARAKPDGYTLLMGVSTMAMNPAMYRKLPYDVMRDLAPITQAASLPNVIIVHPSLPVKSVKDVIALARTRPGELQYASGGTGGNPHLTMELFASMAQIRLTHVPYKSGTAAMIAVLSGEVPLMAQGIASSISHVRAGKLRALGVTSRQRVSIAPEMPTIAELGLAGFESLQWPGLMAPAGTPRDVIARLNKEAVAILQSAQAREALSRDGAEVVAGSPEEFAALIRSEIAKWGKVIKLAGIQPE
jgi:tripartite-type tricarboxylate transporter receptor subunit TctC